MKDFIFVHGQALKKTVEIARHIPVVIILLFLYDLIFTLFASFIGSLGFLAGILLYIIKASLFSHLLYSLYYTLNNRLVPINFLQDGLQRYLSPAMTAFFTYYLIELLITLVFSNLGVYVRIFLRLLVFLLYSAVGENIYLNGTYSYESIYESFDFVKDNFINWALPFGLLYLGMIRAGINLDVFVSFTGFFGIDIRSLISYIFMGVFLVYKGNLYLVLFRSSKRKREYQHGW